MTTFKITTVCIRKYAIEANSYDEAVEQIRNADLPRWSGSRWFVERVHTTFDEEAGWLTIKATINTDDKEP